MSSNPDPNSKSKAEDSQCSIPSCRPFDSLSTITGMAKARMRPVSPVRDYLAVPLMSVPGFDSLVDSLAQAIRSVDGRHSMGAGALAEALMPWMSSALVELRDRDRNIGSELLKSVTDHRSGMRAGIAPSSMIEDGQQPLPSEVQECPASLIAALYDAAGKGFHTSETCGLAGKYLHISKFNSLADLHAFDDARTALLIAGRDRLKACNGSGVVHAQAEAADPAHGAEAWGVYAKSDENPEPILIPEYVGSMSVIRSRVMEKACREGFNGGFDQRMAELGWWVEPLFRASEAPAVVADSAMREALGYTPGNLDKTSPAAIWLQIDTDGDNSERGEKWPGYEHVTWHDEQIGGLEIQYVRADLVTHEVRGQLDAAPSIDLEQFRPAVCAMGLYAEGPADVDEAKRLLALIDGQAAPAPAFTDEAVRRLVRAMENTPGDDLIEPGMKLCRRLLVAALQPTKGEEES